MAMNYGLLGTAAEGVQAGLNAYQTTQKMKRDAQLQNLTMGIQQDDNGALSFTPEMQQKRQQQTDLGQAEYKSGLLKASQMQEAADPTSELSHQYREAYRGLLPPKAAAHIPDTISAAQLKELMPLAQAGAKAEIGINSPIALGRLDLTQQTRAGAIGKDIENDKVLQTGVQSKNAADRGLNILSQPKVTSQMANTAFTDLARIIQGGGSPAQGTIHEQSYNTLYMRAQNLLQNISGNPEDALPEPIKKQLVQTFQEMKDVNDQAISDRAANKIGTYRKSSSNNPYAISALDDLESRYVKRKPQEAGLLQGAQSQQPQAHPQDSAAVQWAKANPKDPRSVAILKANGL